MSFYRKWFLDIFNLFYYLPAFAVGVFVYQLFKYKKNNIALPLFIKVSLGVLFVCFVYSGLNMGERIIYIFMFLLFLCFVYFPNTLSFLENKLILRIGVASYFLYLIHENIAILIIHSFGQYFSPFYFILPLLLICLMIFISILYTEYIDKKITAYLKKIFLSKE